MSGFQEALPFVLRVEGGFANHPNDPGGATMRGVTTAVYDRWRKARNLATRDVRMIADDELQDIYRTGYWIPGRCEALPWPVGMIHFDACVNHGTGGAAKILQRAVGVADDGKIGPQTLGGVASLPMPVLCGRMLFERLDYYERITFANRRLAVFLLAWLSRVNALRDEVRRYLPEAP